jgi:16S rRNA (guanine527-N7)-methyltransferase
MIAFPQWRVTLLEATGKKVRFLEAVLTEMGATHARAIAGRAEELAHQPAYRAAYDVVTARAVAALPTLLEYCCPFARVGGRVIAPKKGDLADEVAAGTKAASLLGAKLLAPIPLTIPPLADGRALLVAEQKRACPQQYPRPAGAPAKHPLGAVGS